MFEILKKKKQQKIALENGKQILICRGVLAWQAFQVFTIKQDEESDKSFKSLMKNFYYGKLKNGRDVDGIIYIPYCSLVYENKRLARKVNKELALRGVEVKSMINAYKKEIMDTEICYGY